MAKAKAPVSIKGWKHSKPGLWLSIGTSAFGAVSIVKDVKKARLEQDTLKLINAVVGAVALVTGTALLLRELKQLGDDDVLLG
ncbi:membrane protein [Saccharothrix sp. ST-888]|nr:membrane protein [Saccharothrix sp. ST-888]